MIISRKGLFHGLKGKEIQKFSDVEQQIKDANELINNKAFDFNTAKQKGITDEVYQYIEATDRATVSTEGFYEAITKNSHGLVNATQLMNSYNKISKQDSETKQAFINGLAKNNVDLANNIDKAAKTGGVAKLGVKNFLTSIASSLGTGLFDIGISLAASFAINSIATFVDTILPPTEAELKKISEEIKSAYDKEKSTIENNISSIESYSSEYSILSKGVDSLGNNVSLTSDEYDRYKEIVSSIADINPELVSGYNEQGVAILNTKDAIDKTIESLNEYNNLKDIEFTTTDNMSEYLKGLSGDYKQYSKNLTQTQEQLDQELSAYDNWLNSSTQNFYETGVKNLDEYIINLSEDIDRLPSALDNKLNQLSGKMSASINRAGIFDPLEDGGYLKPDGTLNYATLKDLDITAVKEYLDAATELRDSLVDYMSDEEYELFTQAIGNIYMEMSDGSSTGMLSTLFSDNRKIIENEYLRELNALANEKKRLDDEVKNTLKIYSDALIEENGNFNDAQKALIQNWIGQYDISSMIEEGFSVDSVANARLQISKFVDGLSEALKTDDTLYTTLDLAFQINTSELDYDEYKSQVDDVVSNMLDSDWAKNNRLSEQQIRIMLGYSIETNEGEVKDKVEESYKNMVKHAWEVFGENDIRVSSYDIPVDRINEIDQALRNIDKYEFKTFRDLVDSILGLRTFGTFNPEEWFNDDEATNSKGINTIVSEMDTLLSALDTLNAGEELDVTWFKDFPELLEYADDIELLKIKIQELASQKPEGIINELIKLKDSLVDEKDIEAVQNLIDLLSRKYTNSAFDDIVEQAEKTETQMNSLQAALDSLVNGDPLEVTWFEDFPDLAKYAGDAKALQEAITEKLSDLPEKMLRTIEKYKKENQEVLTVQEEERLTAIEIMLIQAKITNERKAQTSLITEQKNKAEEELEILNKQRDALEETISQYESAANAIINAIDDEIEKLEEGKAAIEEKYNAEIEALQKENEERDRSNALREKELALEKAKNDKVRVYSAARGWTIQTNSEAVKTAQKEYDDQVNSNKIAELEEQRDAETKVFDERIKEYEDYKEMWQDALNEYQNMQDEMNAAALFGANWRTIAINRDVSAIGLFVSSYGFYQEQLNQMVNPEIERIQSQIDKYNEKIDALGRLQQAEEDYYEHYKKMSGGEPEGGRNPENSGSSDWWNFWGNIENNQNGAGFKFLQSASTEEEAMTKFNNFMNSGSPTSLLGGASLTNLRIASGFKGVVDKMVGNHAANVITQKSGNVINNQYGWTITGNEINADKYETFKGYMDRYVREAQMNLSVGKR